MTYITHYTVTHNETGHSWNAPFTASGVHSIVGGALEALAAGNGLTHEQATQQLDIWNRAQSAHRQEFTYSFYPA